MIAERDIDDLLGEALRRHRHGLVRPLWADMLEGEQKRAWRRLGMAVLNHNKQEYRFAQKALSDSDGN